MAWLKVNSLATVEDMMLGESAAMAPVDNEVENAAIVAASTGIDLEKMRLSFFMGGLSLGQLGFANSTGGGVGGALIRRIPHGNSCIYYINNILKS